MPVSGHQPAPPDPLCEHSSTMAARPSRSTPRALLLALAAALLSTLLVGVPRAANAATDPSEDQPRLPDRCLAGDDNVPHQPGACYVTRFRKNRPTVVLWGDSHSWQHIPAVRPLAREKRVNLVMFMLGGCPPILVRENSQRTMYACERSNQLALRFVRDLKERDKPVRVLLGAFWDGYYSVYQGVYVDHTIDPSGYTTTQLRSARTFHRSTPKLFAELGELGVRVDVIGQAATVPENPPSCLGGDDPYECRLARSQALPREQAWRGWFRQVMRPLPDRSRLIGFNDPYCDAAYCYGKVDDIYTFFDPIHLSATRTATFRRYYRATFANFR